MTRPWRVCRPTSSRSASRARTCRGPVTGQAYEAAGAACSSGAPRSGTRRAHGPSSSRMSHRPSGTGRTSTKSLAGTDSRSGGVGLRHGRPAYPAGAPGCSSSQPGAGVKSLWRRPTGRPRLRRDPRTCYRLPRSWTWGGGRSPEAWEAWREAQRRKHGNGNGHGQSLYQALGCPEPVEATRAMERMMGLPEGWVTSQGLKVSAARRLLGNGVAPAQGALGIWRALNSPI